MQDDAFERLGVARAAALDAEALKAAYLEKNREAHPDRAEGDAVLSAELNAAYETLREPESRLKHLLELEHAGAGAAWGTVPMEEALMAVFARLGPLLQKTEAFAKKRDAAASALGRALLAGEQMALQEELETVLVEIEQRREDLEAELAGVDALRAAGADAAAEKMRTLRAKFAYLGKWRGQAREALARLF